MKLTDYTQVVIELSGASFLTVLYYAISMYRYKDCDHKKLGWVAATSVGIITGGFIFISSYDVMKASALNGLWSGIAGIIITLATATELFKEFRCLARSRKEEVSPVKDEGAAASVKSANKD